MDDYDDSFWDFDFDGDGDIDANDDLWGDLLFLAHLEALHREARPVRASTTQAPRRPLERFMQHPFKEERSMQPMQSIVSSRWSSLCRVGCSIHGSWISSTGMRVNGS